MTIKFDKDLLAVEQHNYLTKSVNVYIVYELYDWPKNPTNNFKFKTCLFGATNVVKSSDKEKYVYRGYGITFVQICKNIHYLYNLYIICKNWWSCVNDTVRNVIIFYVDNSSSSLAGNRKN